jgi:hypothetical protein
MNDISVKDRSENEIHEERGRPKPQGTKPTKPWETDIDVYLTSVGPPAQFQISTCLPLDQSGNIVFYNNGRPGFMLHFRLYDQTNNGAGSGYVFPSPPAPPNQPMNWAMWSSAGSGCPVPGCGQWSEFTTVNVKDQGTTLVVQNTNTSQTVFGYTLRVTNDNGSTFVDLDPGGNNQNGSGAQS